MARLRRFQSEVVGTVAIVTAQISAMNQNLPQAHDGLSTKTEEDKMAHTQYVVVRDQGQWKISLNGVHYGPYATQRDAVRAAVDAAHEAGRKGLNGQVLIRDQFRIEWTYGKDPYPPNSSDYLDPYANAETPAIGSAVPGSSSLANTVSISETKRRMRARV